jgi:hypothetical protein
MNLRKSDLDGLKRIQKKTETFADEIFDWVSILGKQEFLKEIYSFEDQVVSAIKHLEKGE